jgi:uncharacterized RDD family membrane protein YckC
MNATSPNPYAPPTAEVSDIAEEGALEHADRGTRLGAAIVDTLVSAAVALPLLFSLGMNIANPEAWVGALFGVAGILTMVLAIAWLVYTIYLVNKNSQTIGKKLLGIKVVRSDGSRATLGRIFWLRNIVNAIPSLIPYIGSFYGLVDSLWIFAGENRQCLHDKIADTIVVKA